MKTTMMMMMMMTTTTTTMMMMVVEIKLLELKIEDRPNDHDHQPLHVSSNGTISHTPSASKLQALWPWQVVTPTGWTKVTKVTRVTGPHHKLRFSIKRRKRNHRFLKRKEEKEAEKRKVMLPAGQLPLQTKH
ncbi:hypothetical protein PoB_006831600 [Plakobranchus ocellatus]|uniref:Secreted protein n=1 Tax=Plakobranchus ocellatus TaxID=259542 RepID=A0AAV4DCL4_9GAST|nr:hypothetical protein PoB_006831600 [Plakobranchus ocellatus]